MFDPCKGQNFGRISEKHMFDENLSVQAKLIIAYINGKICQSKDGKVELTKEIIAKLIGTKIGKNGKRSLSQAKRYLRELKNSGIIESKQGLHTNHVWFKNPWGSNMTLMKSPWGSYMTSMIDSTFIKERLKKSKGDFLFKKHPELDSILNDIPFDIPVTRIKINENLWNHGKPYVAYVLRSSLDKNYPRAYFKFGMENYMSAFLKSPEYGIADFKMMDV